MPRRYVPTPIPQDDNAPLRAWLDTNNRAIAAAQPDQQLEGFALLFEAADDVIANDVTETPILNYTDSFDNSILVTDPVAGTITLPNKAGLANVTTWVAITQVTVTRNFTVQLKLEVNGVWLPGILGSGYIPQNGTNVSLAMGASLSRSVNGSEILRLGLILDGASPATFEVTDSSFEVQYLTVRG